MNNLEMLKLAAKSAGYEVNFDGYTDLHDWFPHGYDANTGDVDKWWNPLRDDGDALRLASELRLLVKPGKHKGDGCSVDSQQDGIAGCTAFYDDPAKQMRFAIVRVAAEIGSKMP